jgi:hypothetical protein
MTRYLKWQWALPRLAFVALLIFGTSYLLGLAAKSAAIRTGKQFFGTGVKVGHARVPLTSGFIELSGIHVGGGGAPNSASIAADYCELKVALRPLLNNEVVIERGRIYGLRFADDSKANQHPSPKSEAVATSTLFADDLDRQASKWLTALDGAFARDLAKEFETTKRTDAFCERWAAERASLEKRAEAVRNQSEGLMQSAAAAEANRLRHTTAVDEIPTRIAAIREDVQKLAEDYEKLPELLDSGRREIVAARRQDETLIGERLKFESIPPEAFTAYLLREQVESSVEQLLDWLRGGRQFATASSQHVVVRSLEFQSAGKFFDRDVEWRGLLTGFSTQPTSMREPMRLRMKTVGATPIQVRAMFDSRQSTTRDELYVDCRELQLPEVSLGRSSELRLNLSPSVGSMTVSLRRDGNQLAGDVQLVQKQVQITSAFGDGLTDVAVAAPFGAKLAEVKSLATHFTLGGTVDSPTCTLWSNLGPAVAEAMNRAVVQSAQVHAAEVLAESRRNVDERLALIERELAEQQAKFANGTASLPQRLDSLAREQTRRERISVERLGSRLPNNSLFR